MIARQCRPLGAAARVAVAALAVALGLLVTQPASAHQPGQTVVRVSAADTPTEPGLVLVGEITMDRLDLAYNLALSSDSPSTTDVAIAAHRDELTALIADRVSLTEPTGAAWTIAVADMRRSEVDGYPTLRVDLHAKAPNRTATAASTSPDTVQLRWDVVTDVIYSHKVFVAGVDARGTPVSLGPLLTINPYSH